MLFVIRYLLARLIFHPLEGLTWPLWRDILHHEGSGIAIRAYPKAALLTAQSLWQSFFGWRVERRFGAAINAAEVRAPVFILGHYRSGTTHLHELMSLDPRFASPTRFQAYHPRSFLATERWFGPINDLFMLPRRVQEDEVALMNLAAMSPYLEWVFPEGVEDYTRYLTFRADPDDARTWQDALRWYLQALTIRHRRPILLKSPPHTARMALIRAVFPDAKFVHIRRDPFAVFVSTVRLLRDIDPVFRLRIRQGPISEGGILRTYEEMYDQYLADVPTIPPGQLTEIAYEDLEADPLGQLARIYRELDLGEFEAVRPTFETYLTSIAGYQKNRHPQLDPATRSRIVERWGRFFRHWGYPTGGQDPSQAS